MSNNLNWQRRAHSVAPKNKKFQQKREFSKQKEGNLNENYSTDFENKFEEEEEGRELQLNNFVDEISKIKLLLTNLEYSTQFWNIEREENNKRNNLFNLQQQQTSSINSKPPFNKFKLMKK
uniref:Uncharacterized protein n=1 Tax=Meloidogyne enterolobii TaxID=390850 RepID=A0A6V7TKJ1_MELEN|nr:unnamed protein product [Meloidogyne enterolobii]